MNIVVLIQFVCSPSKLSEIAAIWSIWLGKFAVHKKSHLSR